VVVENPDNEKHRHLSHIEELINRSNLSDRIKEKSLAIFDRIAEAEAKVHGISKNEVHFHEVGALDSIADIVGAAICQEYIEVDEIQASTVELGGGFVKCAHGMMPVPAPATAEIIVGMPVRAGGMEYEATTPTGAAILAETVDCFTERPEMRVVRTGYGIGQRDGEIPNVLRVYLAESQDAGQAMAQVEEGVMLECNLDDMNPEWYSHVQTLLFEGGAAEVFVTPVVMKKSRPGQLLSVLCDPGVADRVKEILFTETSTIGLREYVVNKHMLRREIRVVQTKFGDVNVKRSFYGDRLVNEKPEFEQCRKIALEKGLSLAEVQQEVIRNL
jgi:uncharacterized protein (TIGR00299 family) protein